MKDAVGELDFDNAEMLNFDGVYEFSVTYTVGTESVREDIALTVTDTLQQKLLQLTLAQQT